MNYKYRAKKGPQEIIEGVIEANSEEEAVDKISKLGYVPVRLEKIKEKIVEKEKILPKKGRVKAKEITVFSRQLASLLKSGVPILDALDIISEQTENLYFKHIIREIYKGIKEGSNFSTILSNYSELFSPLYIAMIRSGEDTGNLAEVLLRIVEYRKKNEEFLSRFRMALAYPLLMTLVGIATIIFMLTYVMPRLMGIFAHLGEKLPLPTRILISLTNFLRQGWLGIVLLIAIFISIFRREAKTKSGKRSLSMLKLKFPLLRELVFKKEISRFSRTLELLLRNGIPILKAMEIAIPVLNNEILKEDLWKSYKQLEEGGSLGKTLKDSKIFPPFMSNLIVVGEESGKLDEALGELALAYERDTDEAMRIISNLLEPLIILVMGIIVGFIVISMILPLFEITTGVR